MDRITLRSGRQLRRLTLLLGLTLALVLALMPTAAFASGRDSRSGYGAHNQYSRQPQYNQRNNPRYDNQRNYQRNYQRNNQRDYQRNYPQHDYDRPGYDRYDGYKHDGRCATSYRVRRGDTLSEIARHYHTSVYSLARANGIRNVNRIVSGQVLCIP